MELSKKQEERIKEELETVDVEERYRNWLDETEKEVEVAGLTFSASRIVEEMDPTAFRCGVNDFVDMLLSDGNLIEIGSEYYDHYDAEKIAEEVADEEAADQEAKS